jgi:lipoprotein-releasing system permease protein
MNLPFKIAARYLFARKSTNAINIISGITIFGLSIGTAALILVLSVFNGFEDLLSGLFSAFNPDIKVTIKKGKTFSISEEKLAELKAINGVKAVSQTLQETAFFEYKKNNDFGTIKGVDDQYVHVSQVDSTIREGIFELKDGNRELAVLGVGMRNKLSIDISDPFSTVNVYMAKRKQVTLGNPFRKRVVSPVGTFAIQQEFDQQYVITSIDFARSLLDVKPGVVSALEISLNTPDEDGLTQTAIQKTMGDDFAVKNRFQQDEAFLKLMNVEKWMSFAILSLTLVLVAFNMIGALWMIVLEKRKDIAILKSMGATSRMIRQIFLNEGLLLCLMGIIIGTGLALLLYGIQKGFGIVPIPTGFVVDAYPISIRLWDFMIVSATVIGIGLLASIPPALRAARVSAMIREE